MRYIWQTIILTNWGVMHIGRHFSLANRATLSVHCLLMLHNTHDYTVGSVGVH